MDPEDLLADSFPELTGRATVVALGDHRQLYTHPATGIQLSPPDTHAKNWALHANSIWASSIFLADRLRDFGLDKLSNGTRVIELGAGAGGSLLRFSATTPSSEHCCQAYRESLWQRLQVGLKFG